MPMDYILTGVHARKQLSKSPRAADSPAMTERHLIQLDRDNSLKIGEEQESKRVRGRIAANAPTPVRPSVVALLLCALLIAGFSSTIPLKPALANGAESPEPLGAVNLLVQALGSGSDAGGMAEGGGPWRDCARFEAVVAIINANGGNRDCQFETVLPECNATGAVPICQSKLCSTPSVVSPSLGRQFTLVGAKPSGTS